MCEFTVREKNDRGEYCIYLIKRRPRINAALEGKNINKCRARIDAAPMMRRLFESDVLKKRVQ